MSLQQVGSSDSFSQLGCHVPSQLQTVSSGAHLSAPLQYFSPSAINRRGCSQSAMLHSVNLQLCLRYVSSAIFCQLSCNLYALAYSVIYCDRPVARHQLSYEVQDPLQSVISAAVCLLSHDMSACQQSVSSVCQLSCNRGSSAAMCFSSAQLLSEGSIATCQLSCQFSCNLSAELHPISSHDIDSFSCNVMKEL